ncbi:hypothetical protein SLS58_011081 [Diplodia intermedia]|uniref:Uncharacterized protein n=1 Tax=Diplodia intermedia TaxID=856260 RepID=A0ABR3T2S4_9PEZI
MENQPPPYTSAVDKHDQILSRAAAVLRADQGSTVLGHASRSSIERLRNFLCYVLYVDYEAGTANAAVSLPAADATHFRSVNSTYWRYINTLDATAVEEGERIYLGAYFWENVYAPAQALCLPAEVVLSCMTRFNAYQTCQGTYKSCIPGEMQMYGFERIAGKLVLDRHTVIPRVAPNPAVEQALISGLEKTQRRWFDSLDGFGYEAGRRLEVEGGSWYHSDFNEFELTTEATRVLARLGEARRLKEREKEQARARARASPATPRKFQ